VETPHPVETPHAYIVFYFRRTKGFHANGHPGPGGQAGPYRRQPQRPSPQDARIHETIGKGPPGSVRTPLETAHGRERCPWRPTEGYGDPSGDAC